MWIRCRLIFTPMYGGFTDCTQHASAAALIHRQHFIGFLHKQNCKAASTQINLLSLIHVLVLDETWSVAYNLGETQTCNIYFLLFYREILGPVPELSFLPAPYRSHIGAEPGRTKEESRITCMRMLRTPPFSPQIGGKTIFGSTFQIWLVAWFSEW